MAHNKKNKLANPFVYEGYKGAEYFCDRIEESEKIIKNLQNGVNTTLVSPRKIGKTGLIKHVFSQIKNSNKDAICIYVDIFHTQNQYEFVQALGNAIIQEKLLDSRSSMEKILGYFSHWRPVISFDTLTGSPSISVTLDRSNTEHTIESILGHLNNSNKEVFVAIDEFQTITDYPEKGTEALLRSHIQFMHNVHFIFSGSKKHLLYEMFGSPKRPFYHSTSFMDLHPLREDVYYDFAAKFFKEKKGDFSVEVFHYLYELFQGHTWYMQSVMNRLYQQEKQVENNQQVNEAIVSILDDKSSQYETLITFLTDNQFHVLKAIAKEGCVAQPQSNAFIQKYELPSASSIKKSLEVLTEKDLVYHDTKGYSVYDHFFEIWLKRLQVLSI